MNTSRFGDLEVIVRTPVGRPAFDTPLLFVHGAYAGAWCWDEHFLPYFAARGYICYAVSLSGHGASRTREHLDSYSLDDYVADVADVVSRLPEPPALIGHSMGGLVVQKYLEHAQAPAVALLSSVPPQGLMGSAFGLMMKKPALLQDLNRLLGGGRPNLSSLRDALFHQPIDAATLLRYYRLCQPESHRAIWDMSLFSLPHLGRMHRPPMLIVGAEYDQLIPPDQVYMTALTYGEKPVVFPDIGHGMMLETGWEAVAAHLEGWLASHIA